MVDSLWQDLRYAARLLRRAPFFTFTATLSLAIGIAGTATIFGVADSLLLRSVPGLAAADRLVEIESARDGRPRGNMSYANFADLRDRNTVFAGIAGYRPGAAEFGLTVDGSPGRVNGAVVSGDYFSVLGVPMTLGRALAPDDDRIADPRPVMVIGDQLWRTRFRSDPNVVGRAVHLNGLPFTVVGVAPPGFTGANFSRSDVWVPITLYPTLQTRGASDDLSRAMATALTMRAGHWMVAVGRLRPGVTLAQARDEVQRIAATLEQEFPSDNRGESMTVAESRPVPAQARLPARLFLTLLFALVALILLAACANVGSMLLARGAVRAREVSVRLALGAGRGRVVRQLLTESLLISAIGAVMGGVAAVWLVQVLRGLIPVLPIPVALDVQVGWRLVAFASVVGAMAGAVCGVTPALEAARTDLTTSMKSGLDTRGPRRLRLRQSLVVAQVAVSVLLVVMALLLGRSLMHADSINPGFAIANVEVSNLDLRLAGYDDVRGKQVADDILTAAKRLPNVASAAFGQVVPLTLTGIGLGPLRVAGTAFDAAAAVFPDWSAVSAEYFDTLQIPVLRGRTFTAADRPGAPNAVIINETLARRLWPNGDPLGRTVLRRAGPIVGGVSADADQSLVVVGVVRDARYRSLGEEPRPFAYVAFSQGYAPTFNLFVRTQGASALPQLRAMLQQVAPELPALEASSLSTLTAFALLPQRVAAWTAGAVGGVGLLLVLVGLYGITAHSVAQRTREIGVRMAVGARSGQVLMMVIGQSMRLTAAGALVGLVAAASAAQLLTALLYGITPLDAASFVGATLALGAVALVASAIPARRAATVDPARALRTE